MIWVALGVCLLLAFVLSGLEAAILCVSRVRVRHQAREAPDRFGARWIVGAFRHRERLLSAVLLLNDVVALVAFAIVTRALVGEFGGAGYAFAFALSLPVYLFVFELVPKSLFERFPYRLLCFFMPLLRCVDASLGRLLGLGALLPRRGPRSAANGANGGADDDAVAATSEAEKMGRLEFRNLTGSLARQGLIGASESRMIGNILDLPAATLARVMIPLERVVAVPLDLPVSQVAALARERKCDQMPVLTADGAIVGLVNVFEILRDAAPEGEVIHAMHRIVRASPTDAARDVLVRLRSSGVQLAAVHDATGTPIGIVSAADIIECLLDGV